jgi:hypothetical protein
MTVFMTKIRIILWHNKVWLKTTWIRSKSLWWWYINITIVFLDIIHHPVFISILTGTCSVDWAQLSRFHLKTETESSLRNVVLNKNRMSNNVQKHNRCNNMNSLNMMLNQNCINNISPLSATRHTDTLQEMLKLTQTIQYTQSPVNIKVHLRVP